MTCGPPAWQARTRTGLTGILPIALAFIVLLGAVNAMDARHGGDEALYTDAALRLRANGDYITPRTSEGAPRFNKPVLTYWVIDAGLATFGVSYPAARAGFVLAVAATLVATALLARALFGDPVAGVVAAAILAGNYGAAYAAERAVPDALLLLFVTVALLGFTRLVFGVATADSEPAQRARLLAWAGSGLAVAAKGLLGLVVPLYSLVFAQWRNRHAGVGWRALAGRRSVTLGALLGSSWFVIVTARHGDAAFRAFFFDQVGARIPDGAIGVVRNLAFHVPANLLTIGSAFLPWTALAAVLAVAERQRLREFLAAHRESVLFAGGWCALVMLVFAAGPVTRARYLLPLYPMLAALLGALLTQLVTGERGRRAFSTMARVAGALAVVICLVVAAAGARIGGPLAVAGVLALALTAGLAWLARRAWPAPAVAIGLWMLLAIALYDGPIRATFAATPGRAMVASVDARGAKRVVAVDIPASVVAEVHLRSSGRIWPERLPAATAPGSTGVAQADAILLSARASGPWIAAGYRLEPAGHANRPFRSAEILELLRTGERDAVFARQRVSYYLATRGP